MVMIALPAMVFLALAYMITPLFREPKCDRESKRVLVNHKAE
jgi:hypothetical protein